MIFVSCLSRKNKNMSEVIETFAQKGVSNIELSGGYDYYEGLYEDLSELKEKYNLTFLVHNYFPPPKEHFILNLASLNDEIFEKSLKHYKKSISLAIEFGCPKYALHAGFFMDPSVSEIGKPFALQKLFDKEKSIERFVQGFMVLQKLFKDQIDLYIENNAVSYSNFETYGQNPFMLTCFDDYLKLKELIDFNVLLDLGHLMVSANTLSLDFKKEFENFIDLTDYIHISSNDLKSDLNLLPDKETLVYNLLKTKIVGSKIITLEVDDDIDRIVNLYKEMSLWI